MNGDRKQIPILAIGQHAYPDKAVECSIPWTTCTKVYDLKRTFGEASTSTKVSYAETAKRQYRGAS